MDFYRISKDYIRNEGREWKVSRQSITLGIFREDREKSEESVCAPTRKNENFGESIDEDRVGVK